MDVFGVVMTPDHKVLVNDKWVEGRNVDVSKEGWKKTKYRWEAENSGGGQMQSLQSRTNNASSEYGQAQQDESKPLHIMQISSDDRNSDLENMAGNETPKQGPNRQKLRWSWDRCVREMEHLYEFLRGHGFNILRRLDYRTCGCEWSVLQGQLQMDHQHGTAVQQTQQQGSRVSGGNNTSRRVSSQEWFQQDDVVNETQPRDEWGSGSGRCQEISLWEKPESSECKTQRKAHVYDLVDCGPRNRFLVRNENGDEFIVKNSMGHGIDGLQDNGHILVWFGLNWSLDLYEQFNARIRRQGQGTPVICHRLLIGDTLDDAQALALSEKSDTQNALRSAVKQYRLNKGR